MYKRQEYDITKRVVLTRHFSGPAAINTEKYKYLSKKSRFDYIENSKSSAPAFSTKSMIPLAALPLARKSSIKRTRSPLDRKSLLTHTS